MKKKWREQKGEVFIGFMLILGLLSWGMITNTKQLDECKAANPEWTQQQEKEKACSDVPDICKEP